MDVGSPDEDTIQVPRQVRFPVELTPPAGFDPGRLATWPKVDGRLEYVGGRLLYMPPCGEVQAWTASDVNLVLATWARAHAGFVVGANEAGMRLQGATRAADGAVWRGSDRTAAGGLSRVPPVLAVEVAGDDEREVQLREKAAWYLSVGVSVVWLVLPDTREVVVLTADAESRHRPGGRLPPHPDLPDLTPAVDELFVQIARS